MKILKLVRLDNILLLVVTQLIFKYGFLNLQQGLPQALETWQYLLMVLASALITAGAFLINTISGNGKDSEVVTEATGYNIYMGLNLAAMGIGYYLSDLIGRPGFVAIFIVGAAIPFIYATSLKQTLLISNIAVALTVPLSIIVIAVFNLYPVTFDENRAFVGIIFQVMLDYAIFLYVIALLYSFVRDLSETDNDYNAGNSTLSIALGKERTSKIVSLLTLIPLGLLLYYGNTYIVDLMWALVFGLVFVAGPLIYFMIKMWGTTSQKEYSFLANLLRLILFSTVVSIIVVTYNILDNVKG